MTTWIAHMRIAESLLAAGARFDPAHLAAGSIAPDTGVLTPEGYQTDHRLTHSRDESGEIAPQLFYDRYLANRAALDPNSLSFYAGYYTHLLADVEWVALLRAKRRSEPAPPQLKINRQSIWEARKDWWSQDFLHLQQHPDCLYYTAFHPIKSLPDYLDFLPPGALTQRVKSMVAFYERGDISEFPESGEGMQSFIDHCRSVRPGAPTEYRYLSVNEMDAYLRRASALVLQTFRELQIGF